MTEEEKKTRKYDPIYHALYRKTHIEKIKNYRKIYQVEHKEELASKHKKWREENTDIIQKYKEKNKKKICETQKIYRDTHRDIRNQQSKDYKEKNKETLKTKRRLYIQKNKDTINEKRRERYKKDVPYRICTTIRNRINRSINPKNLNKCKNTKNLVGGNSETLVIYFEKLFKDGMNWSNYGYKGWHIDHIIPCASFDLSDPEEQKKCFHYTNLQPLWWYENLSKGDKIISN